MPSLLQNIQTVENRPYGKPITKHEVAVHVKPRGETINTAPSNMNEIPVHGSPFDAQDYMLHTIFYFVMVFMAHKVL